MEDTSLLLLQSYTFIDGSLAKYFVCWDNCKLFAIPKIDVCICVDIGVGFMWSIICSNPLHPFAFSVILQIMSY